MQTIAGLLRKLRHFIWIALSYLELPGFSPQKFILALVRFPLFVRDRIVLARQMRNLPREFPMGKYYPCLHDRFSDSGNATGHYFHQDLLVARRIFDRRPKVHADVGSRVDGFVAHVASYRQIEVLDIRKPPNSLPNIIFRQADLMGTLPGQLRAYCDSLSCLHALEHFGLGRYGDVVDYDGWRKGISNLSQMLMSGGMLYLSVPIGPQRIEFNAHRVFSVDFLLQFLSAEFTLKAFSYVDDVGELYENVSMDNESAKHSYGCHYGCGIFELVRK